jgi:hypothetical protein
MLLSDDPLHQLEQALVVLRWVAFLIDVLVVVASVFSRFVDCVGVRVGHVVCFALGSSVDEFVDLGFLVSQRDA